MIGFGGMFVEVERALSVIKGVGPSVPFFIYLFLKILRRMGKSKA